MQGYLPIALLVNAIKNKKPLEVGFYNAGTQIVTADSVDMGNGLPAITFDEAHEAGRRSGGDRRLLQAVDAKADGRHAERRAGSRSRPKPSESRLIRANLGGRSVGSPSSCDEGCPSARRSSPFATSTKRYGGVVALADMNLDGRARHDPRRGRRERRRQIDADEDARRRRSGRTAAPSCSTARRSTIDSPNAARAGAASASSTRSSASFPERSVLANLFVNREPTRRGFVSTRAMEDESRDLLDRLGLHVDVACAGRAGSASASGSSSSSAACSSKSRGCSSSTSPTRR